MKVLCKKDYSFTKDFTFKKGMFYETITEYSYDDSYWIQNDMGIYQRFGFKKELYPSFFAHFYTEQELRKLKIKKLNDIAL